MATCNCLIKEIECEWACPNTMCPGVDSEECLEAIESAADEKDTPVPPEPGT